MSPSLKSDSVLCSQSRILGTGFYHTYLSTRKKKSAKETASLGTRQFTFYFSSGNNHRNVLLIPITGRTTFLLDLIKINAEINYVVEYSKYTDLLINHRSVNIRDKM